MQTHRLRMIPKVHLLVHHVAEYVRRAGDPLGPTSEQALESQHALFEIFDLQIRIECLSRTFT